MAAAEYVLARFKKDLDTREFDDKDERGEIQEVLDQIEADVARSWGKYALVLLESSLEAAAADQAHGGSRLNTEGYSSFQSINLFGIWYRNQK